MTALHTLFSVFDPTIVGAQESAITISKLGKGRVVVFYPLPCFWGGGVRSSR